MTILDHDDSTRVTGGDRVRFTGIVRSEFIKLTSLRSTVGLLAAVVLCGLGISLALAATMAGAGLPSGPSVGFMLDEVTIGTVLFGQLLAGVLGALVISGEYASGTIRSTMAAVPSRTSVLLAKAVVVFSAATTVAAVALFGSWAVTYPVFAAHDIGIGLGAHGVVASLVGGSVYVGLSAVLGLGIGALLRSVAGSVATVLSVIFLLPIVLSVLPASQLVRNIHLLSMSKAGDAMSSPMEADSMLIDLVNGYVSAPAGWAVATAWAATFLALGALRLRRGDV